MPQANAVKVERPTGRTTLRAGAGGAPASLLLLVPAGHPGRQRPSGPRIARLPSHVGLWRRQPPSLAFARTRPRPNPADRWRSTRSRAFARRRPTPRSRTAGRREPRAPRVRAGSSSPGQIRFVRSARIQLERQRVRARRTEEARFCAPTKRRSNRGPLIVGFSGSHVRGLRSRHRIWPGDGRRA